MSWPHAPRTSPLQDTVERRLAGSMFRSASVDNPYMLFSTKSLGLEWIADGQQTLGDLLGLLIRLLDVHEVRAVVVILKSLASSELADAKVGCRLSVLKGKVADAVNSNSNSFSPSAFVGIQHWCRGGSAEVFTKVEEFETQSAPDVLTRPASTSGVDRENSGSGSPRRSLSRASSPRSGGGYAPENLEGRGDLSSLRWPRHQQVWYNQTEILANSFHFTGFAQQFRGQPHGSFGIGNHQLRPQQEHPRIGAQDEQEQFMRGVRDEDERWWATPSDGSIDTQVPSHESFDSQEYPSFD